MAKAITNTNHFPTTTATTTSVGGRVHVTITTSPPPSHNCASPPPSTTPASRSAPVVIPVNRSAPISSHNVSVPGPPNISSNIASPTPTPPTTTITTTGRSVGVSASVHNNNSNSNNTVTITNNVVVVSSGNRNATAATAPGGTPVSPGVVVVTSPTACNGGPALPLAAVSASASASGLRLIPAADEGIMNSIPAGTDVDVLIPDVSTTNTTTQIPQPQTQLQSTTTTTTTTTATTATATTTTSGSNDSSNSEKAPLGAATISGLYRVQEPQGPRPVTGGDIVLNEFGLKPLHNALVSKKPIRYKSEYLQDIPNSEHVRFKSVNPQDTLWRLANDAPPSDDVHPLSLMLLTPEQLSSFSLKEGGVPDPFSHRKSQHTRHEPAHMQESIVVSQIPHLPQQQQQLQQTVAHTTVPMQAADPQKVHQHRHRKKSKISAATLPPQPVLPVNPADPLMIQPQSPHSISLPISPGTMPQMPIVTVVSQSRPTPSAQKHSHRASSSRH
ncbi:hypothetical protein Pelo_12 [Pelomyxa schiedti]|nr:hypothetical protein Pelo_12 [Pelomyxa schiedti]